MAETTDTGFIPGRGLTQSEYLFGKPDFYKDYLSLSGIDVKDPDEDDDKDKGEYVAPKIIPTTSGDDDGVNLLSTQLTAGLEGGNYYDTKVKSVDLQSMDLTSKSWQDYKKSIGTADKTNLTRDLSITSVGLGIAGVPGAMVGGAILGQPINTPWGVENPGAGMFSPIGNYAISEKYNATKEVMAAQAALGDPEQGLAIAGEGFLGDGGHAIYVDGTYLVRRPNDFRYIGTLPPGVTNQQVLNLEAIQKGFLPSSSGISTEQGFGVGGEGGYKADGSFVDANGVTSAYGSMKGLQQLANKEFGGDINKAQDWLTQVRAERGLFSTTMTLEKANQIKANIQKTIDMGQVSTTPKPPTTFDRFDITGGGLQGEEDIDRNLGIVTGPEMMVNQFNITGRGLQGEEDIDSPPSGTTTTTTGRPTGTGARGLSFRDDTEFVTPLGGFRPTPTSVFNDMINRQGISPKDAADALTDMLPQGATSKSSVPNVVPASYSESTDSDGGTTITQDQIRSEKEMGLDPFGGAGDPVQTGESQSDDKIVCTAMNNAYGFGSFRQTVWLNHSRNLDPAYQKGYHRIFRPLVKLAYNNNTMISRVVKDWLEGVARRRTADIWAEKRGKQRKFFNRLERSILEPICYIVGKL